MRLEDMYAQPGYLVRRVHQRATALFASVTEGYELTPVQLSTLLAIAEYPHIDIARVSDLIGSDRSTLTQALTRLRKKGLVIQERSVQDRRSNTLTITAQGEELIASVAHLMPQVEAMLFSNLTPAQRRTMKSLLAKIAETDT